jgi:hypothetical protein
MPDVGWLIHCALADAGAANAKANTSTYMAI